MNSKIKNTRKEIWKTIDGHSNYQISNKGRVRKNDGTPVTIRINKSTKYNYVSIKNDDGKYNIYTVHRLVASAFIDNPNCYEQVDHIDGCRTRNCVSNLRWVSRKFNNSRKRVVALKSKNYQHILHQHQFVKATNAATGETKYFKNANTCALGIGCSHVMAIKVLRGEFKTAKGWRLNYIYRDSKEGKKANVDLRTKHEKMNEERKRLKKERRERIKELALPPRMSHIVLAINPKTNNVERMFSNPHQAQKYLGINRVADAAYGLVKTAGEYKWAWMFN